MNKVKVNFEELKSALKEIEARSGDVQVHMEIIDRKLIITATDRSENVITAKLYDDNKMGAEFIETQRLMFMKDKKRV